MIGLDTNILVRYLTQDDQEQAARAGQLIETHCTKEEPGHVALVVLCEMVWVLRGAYGYEKYLVIKVLEQLLTTSELRVEAEHTARSALAAYRRGPADFADYVIIFSNRGAGCKMTYTFDQKMDRHNLARML